MAPRTAFGGIGFGVRVQQVRVVKGGTKNGLRGRSGFRFQRAGAHPSRLEAERLAIPCELSPSPRCLPPHTSTLSSSRSS